MLSIIIPIYNVENYLNECLDSILRQSYHNYQVIMVNDGSTDSSLEIANMYVEKDQRFKVYTKVNGGLSSARNYGLKYVDGEYLTFLDSDDYLSDDAYENMMKIIGNNDIVLSNIRYFFENNTGFDLKGLNTKVSDNINEQALLSPMFAWNKIYKTKYFIENNILYPNGLWYEDIPVTVSLFVNTDKIVYLNETCYYYRQRSSSIMGQKTDKQKDIFKILEMTKDYLVNTDKYQRYYHEIEYLYIEHLMLYGQYRFLVSDNYQKMYEETVLIMNDNFINYKKNKYIKYLSIKNKIFIKYLNKYTINIFRTYLMK